MVMFEDDQTTNKDDLSFEEVAAQEPQFDASAGQDASDQELSVEQTPVEEQVSDLPESPTEEPAEALDPVDEIEQPEDEEAVEIPGGSAGIAEENPVEPESEKDTERGAAMDEGIPHADLPPEGTETDPDEIPDDSPAAEAVVEPMVTEAASLIEEASAIPKEVLDEGLLESAEEFAAQPQSEATPFAEELANISEAESAIAGELAAEFVEQNVQAHAADSESEGSEEGQLGDAIAVSAEEEEDGRHWYVVHCYSGYENKVRHNLEQRIESMGMKDLIFDVVVPTEEEIEVKDGKRRSVERRVFPGYILVNMLLTEESWYVVRNTPGVTSFVGMGNDPIPLRPEEVSQIIKRMEADAPRIKVTFRHGERVRIVDGPFNDFRGTVSEIDMEKAKVRIMVNFFGRETPVELDFLQVEKA